MMSKKRDSQIHLTTRRWRSLGAQHRKSGAKEKHQLNPVGQATDKKLRK